MNAFISLAVVGLVLGLSGSINAHTYHLGECPNVEPQSEFNMKQFLGLWYVIQKTSTSSKCLIYNITEVPDEPKKFRIEQTNPIPGVGKPYHYTGELTQATPGVPGKMVAKFPLSVAGTADYTVFLTDYNTYAGIFTCQKLPLSHRHSATILSRTKTLDKIYSEKLRSRLSNAGINPYDLSIVDQGNCDAEHTDEDKGIHIHPETFSSKNIGEAVKKVGSSIGDGFESLADGTKNLFNKITGGEQERDREELDVRILGNGEKPTTEQYAEWLP